MDPVRRLLPVDELGRRLGRSLPVCGADRDRARCGWAATDFIVTGNPLFSLTSTQDLAAELERTKSGSDVLSALPQLPARHGQDAGLLRRPDRARDRRVEVPAADDRAVDAVPGGHLHVRRDGLAGLSVIVRYLLVPSVMLTLFAAVAARRVDDGAARRAAAARVGARRRRGHGAGLAYTAYRPPSPTRFNNELTFRGEQGRSLHRCWRSPAVERGLRCGAGVGADAQADPRHALGARPRGEPTSSPAPIPRPPPSARRATGSRSSRSGARTSCGPGSRSTPTRSRRCPPGLHAHRHRQVLRRLRALPAGACLAPRLAGGAGRPLGAGAGRRARWARSGCGCGASSRVAVRLQRRRGLELRPDGGQLLLHRQLQPALLHQPAGVLVPAARLAVRGVVRRRRRASARRSRPTRPRCSSCRARHRPRCWAPRRSASST